MIVLNKKKLKRKIKRFRINLYKFLHYKYTIFSCFMPFDYSMLREEDLRPVMRENRRCMKKLEKLIK